MQGRGEEQRGQDREGGKEGGKEGGREGGKSNGQFIGKPSLLSAVAGCMVSVQISNFRGFSCHKAPTNIDKGL